MTREQVETALDSGRLWLIGRNARWYQVRRNGRTQTGKTRPDDFSIPAKVGLNGAFRIVPRDVQDDANFRISDERPT